MSVTGEDDQQENGYFSGYYKIVAAAISLGVGAAIYYFFSETIAQQHLEESPTEWIGDGSHSFYTCSTSHPCSCTTLDDDSTISITDFNPPTRYFTQNSLDDFVVVPLNGSDNNSCANAYSHSENNPPSISLNRDSDISDRLQNGRSELTEDEQSSLSRQELFKERPWTQEECSICCEIMLRDQELIQLPCAHNFHTDCVLPWLQEKQTCPICRKPIKRKVFRVENTY